MKTIDPSTRDIVLVVDDAPGSLGMLTDALEEAGYTVLVAMDGPRALELVQTITPHAILLDAVMPGIDGFETCRQLKRLDDMLDVPVIFMTGLSDTEHIVRGLEAGGVDYIAKPIDPTEMIARLRVHLANARHSQSARIALDVSGRFLLSVDTKGYPCWSTPQARALLGLQPDPLTPGAVVATDTGRLPTSARNWLASLLNAPGTETDGHSTNDLTITINGHTVRLTYMGEISQDEHLLRVIDGKEPSSRDVLKDRFSLTEREADVLTWITNGKSNKEIAAVLEMSPRTVNKHLDRIFSKLGVENRTSAAIVSFQAIAKATSD